MLFKLLLTVTVIATGQVLSPMEHIESPFQTREACFTAASKSDALVLEEFGRAYGPVRSSYQCEPVKPASNPEDAAADGIVRVFRQMIQQGGFGTTR